MSHDEGSHRELLECSLEPDLVDRHLFELALQSQSASKRTNERA